jgi:hypothetical protein
MATEMRLAKVRPMAKSARTRRHPSELVVQSQRRANNVGFSLFVVLFFMSNIRKIFNWRNTFAIT